MGTKRNETLLNTQWQQNTSLKKEYDTDSDNEMLMKSETNWPRFLIVESASQDLPLQKLSPFAVQKGFQAIAGTMKSIKRLRDGSFLVECGKRAQAETYPEQTDLLADQSRSQFTRP